MVGEIDTNQLGTPDAGVDIRSIWHRCTAGVQDPEAVQRVNDHALDADEIIFIVSTCGWVGGVINCTLFRGFEVSIAYLLRCTRRWNVSRESKLFGHISRLKIGRK